MKKYFIGAVLSVIFFTFFFKNNVFCEESQVVLKARVIKTSDIREIDGLKMQEIKVEILNGDYKGNVEDLSVPLEDIYSRILQEGDIIKVSYTSINGSVYFQFYDFSRIRSYIWLVVLFIVILIVLVGYRGLSTLIPAFLMVLFIVSGVIPSLLIKFNMLFLSLLIIGVIAAITAWVRLRERLLTVVVLFSVLFSLLIGYLVFMGFSQVSYIIPFIGSISTLNEDVYLRVIDMVNISIVFIPAGGVITASIQVARILLRKHMKKSKLSLGDMLRQGLEVSQKISARELNNLIIMFIGLNIVGVFVLKQEYTNVNIWDNGWIALQVIYTISSGLAILLITPITTFFCAGFIGFVKRDKKSKGGQRKLKIKEERERKFNYFK